MKNFTAEETLTYLIELFIDYLEEIQEIDEYNKNQFVYGEKTAYIECLEIIQYWQHSKLNGLNFDIEKRFPL